MIFTLCFFSIVEIALVQSCRPTVAPYFDITLNYKAPIEVAKATGQKSFTFAFVLGGNQGCKPMWGGVTELADPVIIGKIRDIQNNGGEAIIATGGAAGPYLENLCTTVESLTAVYNQILDVTKSNHLDIDIESTVDLDKVSKSLALVQKARPKVTVSFTLMVQGDEYGITPFLGVDLLKAAKKNGLRVDTVNPMTMEFGSSKPSWGDAVISASEATVKQMKEVWPEKSESELYRMLGVTPMIGRNFNGKIFDLSHAKQLVEWAKAKQVGLLAFWSIARDSGTCAGGGVSPTCSSIAQNEYEFTKIFNTYSKCLNDSDVQIFFPTTTTAPTTTAATTTAATTTRATTTAATTTAQTTTKSCHHKHKPRRKICWGTIERFDYYCYHNCAMDFCPRNVCICLGDHKKRRAHR